MYTCLYKVECSFCASDEVHNYIDWGVLYANTFTEAAEQLEDFYGCELVAISYLEIFDTPYLRLSEDLFNQVKDHLNSKI
jgi:hypothetical protein